MGVAGAALLFVFISFFRMIGALGKWNAWKKHGKLCPVRFAAIDSKLENYKNKKGMTLYRYALKVDYEDQKVDAFFEELVGPTGSPKYSVGDRAELQYVPAAHSCKDPAEMKGAIRSQAIAMGSCFLIFIGTLWLLQVLGG